jgi:hypothetical protein
VVLPRAIGGWQEVSYRLLERIGSTGSLLVFTVLVTILAVCGLSGLVP